jgi:hypothetical protein
VVEDVPSVGVGGEEGETDDDEEADVVCSLEDGDEAGGEYTEVDCGGSNGVVSATVLEDVVVEA